MIETKKNLLKSFSFAKSFIAIKKKQKYFELMKIYAYREKIIRKMTVKRFRSNLSKIIARWFGFKRQKTRKEYHIFKANELRINILLTKSLKSLKKYIQIELNLRKIRLFFKYWYKEHIKNRSDLEKYTEGCRKRHLKSYYFKIMRTGIKISKQEKLANKHYLATLFKNLIKFIKASKKNRIINSKVLKFCHEKYTTIVNLM